MGQQTGQPLVGLDGHDPLSPAFEHKLAALRPAPMIQIRVQTHQMMRSMVEAGEGLAIVDPFTALGAKASGLDVCPVSPAVRSTGDSRRQRSVAWGQRVWKVQPEGG